MAYKGKKKKLDKKEQKALTAWEINNPAKPK